MKPSVRRASSAHLYAIIKKNLYFCASLVGQDAGCTYFCREKQKRIIATIFTILTIFTIFTIKDYDELTELYVPDLPNTEIRFALSGLPVVKTGINFDKQTHTLADWQIEA